MKRLLYVAHRVPYPPDKGERVRAFHEIAALAAHFRVTVAAPAHSGGDLAAADRLAAHCDRVLTARAGGTGGLLRGAVTLLGGRSATEGYFHSRRLARAIRREADEEPFDVVVAYCSGALPYAMAVPAAARLVDLVDADSAKWAAYARTARWPTSWLYRREAAGVAALERRALRECDAVVLVSRAEAKVLDGAGDHVLAVANGVDTDYFRPEDRPAEAPPTLVFTGTMDYRPNVEGVCWFGEAIWPTLARERPDLRWTIVGRDPAPAVRRLGERAGIEVTGAVPDVRPYLARATVAVAPLLTARGIQNKVLEAMAMGRAVVASPAALEGLEVRTPAEAVEAQPPDEWRDEILDLLDNDERRGAVEGAARAAVAQRFAWDRQMKPLVDLCLDLSGAPRHGRSTANGGEAPHGPVPSRGRRFAVPRAGE
jgi:sugar transferase (PEP-CTERM/EpsH1 system associated)